MFVTPEGRFARILPFLALLCVLALVLLPVGSAAADPGQPPAAPAEPTAPAQPEAPAVWTGYPGTNQAHDAYGYPWPAAPDCDESTVGTGGCVNDGVGFFQGQCTSWVAFRLGQRNGLAFSNWYAGIHWGDARDWAKAARSIGIKPDRTPAVGAVGWYARGHVSYVEEVNADGSIVISEMNTDGRNGFHLVTVVPGGAGWPDRFLHLADVIPVDETAPERPESLAAVPSGAGISVSWRPPADNVGVTGYTVLRDGIAIGETATPAYVDRQASPGQAYTYAVTARDEAGNMSDPGQVRQQTGAAAPARLARLFLPGSARLVTLSDSTLACGRLGTVRRQYVGCAVRTPKGPRMVRSDREIAWGAAESQVFLPDGSGQVWFCRSRPDRGHASACLAFDPAASRWGIDRRDAARAPLTRPTWVMTPRGPARCGMRSDRATCSVLEDDGWAPPRRADEARPGDPLSRAFVGTERGLAFCRVVEGQAACTELGDRPRWGPTVLRGRGVDHGRWLIRPDGPALCPVGGGSCLVVAPPPPPLPPARAQRLHALTD